MNEQKIDIDHCYFCGVLVENDFGFIKTRPWLLVENKPAILELLKEVSNG